MNAKVEITIRVDESICYRCGGMIRRVAGEGWKHVTPYFIHVHDARPKLTSVPRTFAKARND